MKKILIIAAAAILAACATEDYKLAQAECGVQGFSQYPANVQTIVYNETRYREKYDGLDCFTYKDKKDNGKKKEHCRHTYRRIPYEVTVEKQIDVNQAARENVIENCAAQLCLQRFGNAACEK